VHLDSAHFTTEVACRRCSRRRGGGGASWGQALLAIREAPVLRDHSTDSLLGLVCSCKIEVWTGTGLFWGLHSKAISTDKFWENRIYMNTLVRDFQQKALHVESYPRDSKRVFGLLFGGRKCVKRTLGDEGVWNDVIVFFLLAVLGHTSFSKVLPKKVKTSARQTSIFEEQTRSTHSKTFAITTKGAYLLHARHLPPKFTHSMAFARQDPAWHGGFSTFYSMITPKIESSGFFLFPAQTIVLTSPWPRHECHASPTTLQVSSVEYANTENLNYHPSRTLPRPVLPSRTVHESKHRQFLLHPRPNQLV